jgi:O-antigen/teichoic acid export membrane protein
MNLSRLFASNIVWRGIYLLTSVLVTVFMARYLGAELTGSVMYLINTLTLFFMILSFSFESALTFYSSSGHVQEKRLISFAMLWVVIVFVLLLPVSWFWLKDGEGFSGSVPYFIYPVLFIVGNLLVTYCSSLFYARHQYVIPNLLFISFNILLLCFLVWALYTPASGGQKALFIDIYFSVLFLQGLFSFILLVATSSSPFSWNIPQQGEMKMIVHYASKAVLANLLFFLLCRADYWFIERVIGKGAELGNYIQTSRLVQLFQLLPVILASTIFPVVSAGYEKPMPTVMQTLSRFLIALYVFLIVCLLVSGKWLFIQLFGNSFYLMYDVFILLAPGILATSVLALVCSYLSAINRVWNNVIVSVIGLLVIIPLDLLLIPNYGIKGAAIVSSIGYTVALLTAFYFLKKYTSFKVVDFFILSSNDIRFGVKKLKEFMN